MITKGEIYEVDGKRYQIALPRCVGEWATVAIDEADPDNRCHTIIAIELKRTRGGYVPRMCNGQPLRLQNDWLMGMIRRGEAVKVTS